MWKRAVRPLFNLGRRVGSGIGKRYARSPVLRSVIRRTGQEAASYIPSAVARGARKVAQSPLVIGKASKNTKRWLIGTDIGVGLGVTAATSAYTGYALKKERKERKTAITKFKNSLARSEKALVKPTRKFRPVRRTKKY